MGTAYMMSAGDIMNELGVKRSKAYDILKDLNEQLVRDGYATVRGRIPRPYLESRFYGLNSVTEREQ